MMEIKVLGQLEVATDGSVQPLGGPTPRRLLAALTVGGGTVTTDDELIDLMWADRPPADALGALRVTVSRLRTALGEPFREVLLRRATGYQLVVSPGQVDRSSFVRAIDDGRAALHAGDVDCAERRLRSALAAWRGTPWQDLGDRPSLVGPRATLTELHDVAFEDLQEARLANGDAAKAVAALSAAVIDTPYRERRWELLALGLYLTGRQSEALAELRSVRALLDDELGVAPGRSLRELELRILRHDATLTGHGAAFSRGRRSATPTLRHPA